MPECCQEKSSTEVNPDNGRLSSKRLLQQYLWLNKRDGTTQVQKETDWPLIGATEQKEEIITSTVDEQIVQQSL